MGDCCMFSRFRADHHVLMDLRSVLVVVIWTQNRRLERFAVHRRLVASAIEFWSPRAGLM